MDSITYILYIYWDDHIYFFFILLIWVILSEFYLLICVSVCNVVCVRVYVCGCVWHMHPCRTPCVCLQLGVLTYRGWSRTLGVPLNDLPTLILSRSLSLTLSVCCCFVSPCNSLASALLCETDRLTWTHPDVFVGSGDLNDGRFESHQAPSLTESILNHWITLSDF